MDVKEKIEDMYFRFYRIIGRTFIQYSKNKRPASYPYISGDGFRAMANHVYDTRSQIIDTTTTKEGDIVFVGDSLVSHFLETIHPNISSKYVLITHNGDAEVTEELFRLAQDKVIKWYGINVAYDHPDVIPLPLGIENKYFYVCGIPAVFDKVIKKNKPKVSKIFYGFTVANCPSERQPALDHIQRNPFAETLKEWRGFAPYLEKLTTYKMVLSPPGSSVEGHRTWDTLYVKSLPIVKRSITTSYFESIGLPMLLINSWDELDNLNEHTIAEIYTEKYSQANTEAIYFDYWQKKIINKEK